MNSCALSGRAGNSPGRLPRSVASRCAPPGSAWIVLCALSSCLCAGCEPKGQIADSSKTEGCKAGIVRALETFASNDGLAYTATAADADSVFATGKVEKRYARDASSYAFKFGIDKADNACNLKLYQKTISQPGHGISTQRGSYGSVSLPACKCK